MADIKDDKYGYEWHWCIPTQNMVGDTLYKIALQKMQIYHLDELVDLVTLLHEKKYFVTMGFKHESLLSQIFIYQIMKST